MYLLLIELDVAKPNGTADKRSIIIKLCRRDIYSACKVGTQTSFLR